jgi:hypothetical protein
VEGKNIQTSCIHVSFFYYFKNGKKETKPFVVEQTYCYRSWRRFCVQQYENLTFSYPFLVWLLKRELGKFLFCFVSFFLFCFVFVTEGGGYTLFCVGGGIPSNFRMFSSLISCYSCMVSNIFKLEAVLIRQFVFSWLILHPVMDKFIQQYLTSTNDEIIKHNASIDAMPEVDLFKRN